MGIADRLFGRSSTDNEPSEPEPETDSEPEPEPEPEAPGDLHFVDTTEMSEPVRDVTPITADGWDISDVETSSVRIDPDWWENDGHAQFRDTLRYELEQTPNDIGTDVGVSASTLQSYAAGNGVPSYRSFTEVEEYLESHDEIETAFESPRFVVSFSNVARPDER